MSGPLQEGRDFYWDKGFMVLTERFLRERGWCCGNGCRHCPYGNAPADSDRSDDPSYLEGD